MIPDNSELYNGLKQSFMSAMYKHFFNLKNVLKHLDIVTLIPTGQNNTHLTALLN